MFLLENVNKTLSSSLEIQVCMTESSILINQDLQNDETENKIEVESAFEKLNTYIKTQGVSGKDVIYWDGQVREMMENVNKIREGLPMRTMVDDVFNFCEGETKNEKLPLSEDDLKASLAAIEKMDCVLKLKGTEEKRAKLSRLQAEEETRDFLSKLPCYDESRSIKLNLKEFMRVLSDVEDSECGAPASRQADGLEVQKESERKVTEEKSEKSGSDQKNNKFVDRNIRLAKSGRGTLSTTDEENSRIQQLLEDPGSDSKSTNEVEEPEPPEEEESYGIDDETKNMLSQIDQRLEVLRKQKWGPQCYSTLLENSNQEEAPNEEEKSDPSKKTNSEGGRKRLEKINKLLESMKSISKEEITPLSEKEIANLVQQSRRNLSGGENSKEGEFDWLELRPPKKIIADLVSDAKFLMPKFKYRFDNS